MDMHLDINGQSVIVESKSQIRLLGVTIDQTLSFMTHAQNARSKGAQALGSLLYLRKCVNGIKPIIARHLAMSVIFPKMFWASPFWWLSTQSISGPLAAGYHKVAQWITGLSAFTHVIKLLRSAHLPPLEAWLDFISTSYAIRTLFTSDLHGLKPLPDYDKTKAKQPGIRRALSFVADILNDRLENRSTCYSLNIPKILVHNDKQDAKEIHERWLLSLSEGAAIMYTDGSRTKTGVLMQDGVSAL
jgi:hypothetical protein